MTVQIRFKELLHLFFPIFLTLLIPSSLFLMQKLFFARLEPGTLEAGLNVVYAFRNFQVPCVLLAIMTQVSVARFYGAQQWKSIGNAVWQFIWFAILSNFIVLPASILYWKLYFQGAMIEGIATSYYIGLISINWLYPLGTALSCFYLGRGYTRLVVCGKIGAELVTLLLAYIFIFGNQWITPLGLLGGALATGIGQLLYCGLLFALFLQKQHAVAFGSRDYFFRPSLFWSSIQPGVLRALANLLTCTCWSSVMFLMSTIAGPDLRLLSIGGTLLLFLLCFGEALCQALTIMISQIVGSQQYELLTKAYRLGTRLAICLIILMGIPLLAFPTLTLHYLFPPSIFNLSAIYTVTIGVWLCLFFSIFSCIPLSYILAFKNTQFIIVIGLVSWITGYVWIYFSLYSLALPPIYFWILSSMTFFFNYLLYVLRAKKLIARANTIPLLG